MTPTFDLVGHFDVRQPNIETIASANLRLSKTAYFCVFDKSDESLLNDYEALLTAVSEDQKGVTDLFQNIIHGFLIDNPQSVRERVSDQWDQTSIPDRLVAVSPIPLNEEQRKILTAVDDSDCRFITVQGPPGTGKSHTITAIAFNCILNGKNVLILSDKQEALDVVGDKLKTALSSVRQDDDFPDPILRLGKTGNTYTRLISQSSQEKIRNHYRSAKTYAERLSAETAATNHEIKRSIKQTIDAYTTVALKDIEKLHQLEEQIEGKLSRFAITLQSINGAEDVRRLEGALAEARVAISAQDFFSTLALLNWLHGLRPQDLSWPEVPQPRVVSEEAAEAENARQILRDQLLKGAEPGTAHWLAAELLEYPALKAILKRDFPRIRTITAGARIQATDLTKIKELALGLDGSYLFVQGPPGSGKTWTGARLITHLLANGKRVGVTAQSHKAIHNLLGEIEIVARADSVPFRGLKKSTTENPESNYQSDFFTSEAVNSRFLEMSRHTQVLAGTAWLFSRSELDGQLDYLVIDEAGQVSLADALAVGTSAHNLILLGDPLQLAQVSQGIHPPGCGASVLEHLLAEAPTIPEDRGIFLERSYRMHPDVCAFISEIVYATRLHSDNWLRSALRALGLVSDSFRSSTRAIAPPPTRRLDRLRP